MFLFETGECWGLTTKVTAAQDKQKGKMIHKTRKRIELTNFLFESKASYDFITETCCLMIKQRFCHEERNP
jgi:hypothetical protein